MPAAPGYKLDHCSNVRVTQLQATTRLLLASIFTQLEVQNEYGSNFLGEILTISVSMWTDFDFVVVVLCMKHFDSRNRLK